MPLKARSNTTYLQTLGSCASAVGQLGFERERYETCVAKIRPINIIKNYEQFASELRKVQVRAEK